MSAVVRGVKNTFRSGIRTTAVVLILAISMGLALAMLLANQAVKDRLEEVKRSVGTTIIVNPAGAKDFQGGGEPLKAEDLAKVRKLPHIREVSETLGLTLLTKNNNGGMKFKGLGGSGIEAGETNLKSSIEPGTIGKRFHGRDGGEGNAAPANILLPIQLTGISGTRNQQGQFINVIEGRQLKRGDDKSALVGKKLAEKNNLKIGSTFEGYDEEFTVVGIFDSGTEFGNDGLYIPLATAQRVSDAGSEIMNAVVTVDSVDNLNSAVAGIKATLGDDADVTVTEQNALVAVESLRSVEKVSIVGFLIALAAAGVIIFLTMLMIVRERRREIGVLKAIGGSNRTIVTQFVAEAMVLVMISSVAGFGVAAASSNGIAGALVNSNTSTSSAYDEEGVPPGGAAPSGPGFRSVKLGGGDVNVESAKDLIGNVTTNVSTKTLGYGLLAAVVIAIIGSAIPAWFITKIRPAEVLRSE